jgi:hypothetical protein
VSGRMVELVQEDSCSSSQQCFLVACIALVCLVGCGLKDPPKAEPLEPSFRQQVEAVRQGRTREIRSDATVGDVEFAQLRGLTTLETLSLSNALVSDSDSMADALATLVELKELRLEKTYVGDRLAKVIGKLSKLTTINLPNSEISDEGINEWPSLSELVLLRIGSPNLSDAAFETIAKMHALRFLHLIDVSISDAGLKHLHGMQQMESFYLDGGNATDRGLNELIQALPKLHFHRDQQHIPNDPRTDNHRKR